MRNLLIILMGLALPLSAPAYDGAEYPDAQGGFQQEESYPEEQYQEEHYPEDSYPEERYQEESYPEESYPEQSYPEEETYPQDQYQDPNHAIQMQEVRTLCQEYAADVPPEDQGTYIEDCMRSQGY